MDEEKCGTCRFSLTMEPDCFCRRYPPTLFMGLDMITMRPQLKSNYPPTKETHWCGEFKGKETMQ